MAELSEDVDNMISETDDLTSTKAELLRSIARGIVEGLVLEMILENFEAVEKLDRALRGNSAASGSMSAAYCAVAVECTVKLLVAGGGKAGTKYWNAFDRIWNLRIGELERLRESDLVTEEVKKWRDELRSSFGDHEARVKLCGVNTRNEAVSRVRVYLEEEGKSMGLSLFEPEGVRLKESTYADSIKEEIREEDRVSYKFNSSELDILANVCTSLENHDVSEVKEQVRASSSTLQTAKAIFSPQAMLGAEIIMSMSTGGTEGKDILENWDEKEVDDAGETVDKSTDRLAETSNVNVGNVLRENQGNALQQGIIMSMSTGGTDRKEMLENWDEKEVDDANETEPKSTIQLAENSNVDVGNVLCENQGNALQQGIIMSMSTGGKEILENWDKEVDDANETVPKSPIQLAETSNVDIGNVLCENLGNALHQGLMERKGCVCTCEWSEPILGSPVSVIGGERTTYKLIPKRKADNLSLQKIGAKKLGGRRKSRRWSLHEEDALRTAVERFGKCWKFILNMLGDQFDERTEVDLKDKWRNMTRHLSS